MQQFNVTGMSCAACQARVEKAVSRVEGVTSCSVSLLTNSMGVEGTASTESIIAAVKAAGYGASEKGKQAAAAPDDALRDTQTPALKKRLAASVGFLLVLMYFSMGHMMWGWPLPRWFNGNHVAMGIVQLLLAAIIMVINQKFFVSGFKGLISGAPNMDTLVALGSAASFVWSTWALFMMTDAVVRGDESAVMTYMDEFYFESAAMILTLITVGKMLEARSKGKTTDALKSLMKLAPQTATVERGGAETVIPASDVRPGDIFIVRPGESVPVDGEIVEGATAINESALTGESVPVDKTVGDGVSAATINQSGFIRCRATRVGEDTTLSQIIKMVSDASATKAPIAKIADRVSGVFVPVVISIAVITTIVWLLLGREFAFALARGISVLVISCPCALGLATPVAIMVGSGLGARNGILFKTAVSLEQTGKADVVALDKTGTITSGLPVVTDVFPAEGVGEDELISYALSLEKKSEHPLAGAVTAEGERRGLGAFEVENFTALPGNGLSASCGGKRLLGGSMNYMRSQLEIPDGLAAEADRLAGDGKTPLAFALGERLLGVIAVADTIKPDSREAISRLKNMGIRVVMITGDNEKTARAIGREAGVDDVIAGVLPNGKAEAIGKLKKLGSVIMVGDGINDAPALKHADIGMAIGAGADVAIDAADVVLMKSTLSDAAAAISLSRSTLTNIHENLFWAFIYNIIGIPIAAGVFSGLGLTLNPMLAAAAMSLSSFCVVSNALRLNLARIYDPSRDRKKSKKGPSKAPGDSDGAERVIKIKGMMCAHCENRVKAALESLPGVASAQVSHESGTAVIELTGETPDAALKKAVEDEGYKVISIK